MRNRPSRILQLITTLEPGGAENQLLTLTRHLLASRIETPAGESRPRFEIAVGYFKGSGTLEPAFAALGVPVRALRIRGRIDPGCWGRTRRLVRETRPDLVVTHLFKADVYGAAAVRGTRIPLVSHKHNEDTYLLRAPWGLLGRAAARRATRVISISDAVTRFLVDRAGFSAERIVRISHGIDPWEATPIDLTTTFGFPPDAIVFGTVARLTAQKGLDTLIRAAGRLQAAEPRFRLVIVGRGEDEPALRRCVEDCAATDVVHFAGFRPDVPAILAALAGFVLPSRWEGFGIVLLEAMAAGAPIVATRAGGIPEVIDEGRTGRLVPVDDVDALAEAIAAVWRQPDRTRAMVEHGRREVGERFSAARMAAETAAVYEAAIGDNE